MRNPFGIVKHGNGNTPSHRGPNGTGLPEAKKHPDIFPFWTKLKKGDYTRWGNQQILFFWCLNVLKPPMFFFFLHRIRSNKNSLWLNRMFECDTQWLCLKHKNDETHVFCWSNGFLHLSFPFDINSILVGGLEDVLFFHILGSSFHLNCHFSEG